MKIGLETPGHAALRHVRIGSSRQSRCTNKKNSFPTFVLSKATVGWNPERFRRRRRPRWLTQRHKRTIADEMAAPFQLPVVCCSFTDAKRRSLGSLSFPETVTDFSPLKLSDPTLTWKFATGNAVLFLLASQNSVQPRTSPTGGSVCQSVKQCILVVVGFLPFWRERYSALTTHFFPTLS